MRFSNNGCAISGKTQCFKSSHVIPMLDVAVPMRSSDKELQNTKESQHHFASRTCQLDLMIFWATSPLQEFSTSGTWQVDFRIFWAASLLQEHATCTSWSFELLLYFRNMPSWLHDLLSYFSASGTCQLDLRIFRATSPLQEHAN